jgi:hypothetical protein
MVVLFRGATYENKIKKAIIKANNAMASVMANPMMQYRNNFCSKDGFRDIPTMKAPKTVPIPTPAPANPIVADPAPTNFAACRIIFVRNEGRWINPTGSSSLCVLRNHESNMDRECMKL